MNSELQAWLESLGLNFTPDLSQPGKYQNYKTDTGKGWYKLIDYKTHIEFVTKDWRTGDWHKWASKSDIDFNAPDYIAIKEQAEAEDEANARGARLRALGLINKAGQGLASPYLEKKGFPDGHPTLYQAFDEYQAVDVLVPLQDIFEETWNIQTISAHGFKSFIEGGRVKGLFHNLTPLHIDTPTLYLVEGLATGLSVLQLLDTPASVIVAFSATNLLEVARLLWAKYPTHKIIVCADNDHLKDLNFGLKAACDAALAVDGDIIYPIFDPKTTGSDWNDCVQTIGLERAKQEFQKQLLNPTPITHLVETNYGKEIKPKKKRTKKTNSKSQTEFVDTPTTEEQIPTPTETTSDLQHSETSGKPHSSVPEIVREESGVYVGDEDLGADYSESLSDLEDDDFADPSKDLSAYPKEIRPYINGVLPMDIPTDKKGKPLPLTETAVANYLVAHYKKSIRRYGEKDLFKYTGKYWKQLGTREVLALKNKIRVASWGKWGSRQVDATYKTFFGLLRVMGGNPFVPNAQKVSFANCTVHAEENPKTREWTWRRAPHNPADFITHFIPYNLPDEKDGPLPTNPHFMGMLDNIFNGDLEKDKKILLLQEMYGACLFPIFPRLFLIYGQGGTGKSSLIKCAMRLVHPSAQCSVDPTKMSGFRMNSMAGKLVNALTEVELTKPMEDSVIKMVDDRIAITIERKNRDDITATIPAIHIFGANAIPATKDLTTNSMLRRWSFLHTSAMNRSEDPDPDFAHWAFDQMPDAVVLWAFAGALRLFKSRGKYTTFESDRTSIKEWQSGRDSVQQFLDDIRSADPSVGDLRIDATKSVFRSRIWENYVAWCDKVLCSKPRMGRNTFLKALEKKGHPTKSTNKGFRMLGIYSESEKDA